MFTALAVKLKVIDRFSRDAINFTEHSELCKLADINFERNGIK